MRYAWQQGGKTGGVRYALGRYGDGRHGAMCSGEYDDGCGDGYGVMCSSRHSSEYGGICGGEYSDEYEVYGDRYGSM